MDLETALAHARQSRAANIVGIQLHGRNVEVFRPRYCQQAETWRIEYREGALFQNVGAREEFDRDQAPQDAAEVDYFVAPLSEEEMDAVIEAQGEIILHRLLEGAPDPAQCRNPRDKAAFTSWCISTLAERNG
ncbi:hypothetical protein [Motiliproteus sp. SC1-56]|uniref:hypothetical protein n=1 Tax=Motiliproteus sp. SC1-56 TaxID=2799565 RepID=UPI001A8E2DBB|nr:hypothetical protein [Motiliproteus sp. SC1-56]